MPHSFLKLCLPSCAALLLSFSLQAADLYMLPQGAGDQNGVDWDNALSYEQGENGLQEAWEKLGAGDTLFLGGGAYTAKRTTLSADGTKAEDVKTLKGVTLNGQRPVFTGDWQKEDKGKGFPMLTIASGSTWWAIENLVIKNCREAVTTASPGRVSNGRIVDVDVEGTRDAFIFLGGAYASKPEIGTHNIEIRDCDVLHYTKRGFRFRDGCYDITVVNCTADAGGKEWYVEPFPMSFNVIGGSKGSGVFDHDITFIDCIARNNYHEKAGNSYWNADGFCAESTAYNLTYIRCESYGNTDGGWDDKSPNPLLIDCIAKDNKKNYRFWNQEPGVLFWNCISETPFKRGGNSNTVGLWTGGRARIYNSSFLDSAVPLEINTYKVTPEKKAMMNITVVNSIIELPEGVTALPEENFTVGEDVWIRPLKSTAMPEEGTPGYTETPDGVDLLAQVRPLQPLIETKAVLLEAKTLWLYRDKSPSGWYLSGWRDLDMATQKGKGIDGGNALAVVSKGGKGGGASYRTKRQTAAIQFVNYGDVDWELRMSIRTGNQAMPKLEVNVITLSGLPKTQEVPLPGVLNGSETGWQELAIPLSDFVSAGETLEDFAGFYIRSSGAMASPLLIDNVRLEPMP
ncbi:hypothetical protein P3T73_13480 [Kiritimatiellota bacterium B12222]|nr:hypothetical protein P3T73_13480 [Kiritimatiellota bacterium B12222]